MTPREWASQSQSYRRGYVAGQQGEVDFAQLIDGSDDLAEAMQGFEDGVKSTTEDNGSERNPQGD